MTSGFVRERVKVKERKYSSNLDLDAGNILHWVGYIIQLIEIINTALFAAAKKYIVISIKDLLIDFQVYNQSVNKTQAWIILVQPWQWKVKAQLTWEWMWRGKGQED